VEFRDDLKSRVRPPFPVRLLNVAAHLSMVIE
jgi:hypothetical protein